MPAPQAPPHSHRALHAADVGTNAVEGYAVGGCFTKGFIRLLRSVLLPRLHAPQHDMIHTLFLIYVVANHGLPSIPQSPASTPPLQLTGHSPMRHPEHLCTTSSGGGGHFCSHSQAGTRKLPVVQGLIGSQTAGKSKSWTLLWVTPSPETCLRGCSVTGAEGTTCHRWTG